MQENLIIESKSKYNFDITAQKLQETILENKWKLSAVHDLQETLKNNGTLVLPVKVFALCHPKHSSKILSLNDERIISVMMPCRISIYEKEDGFTYLSRINALMMAASFNHAIQEVMKESAEDVENIIQELI